MSKSLGLACLFTVFATISAQAQYYTFSENMRRPQFETPDALLAQAAKQSVQLLSWAFHNTKRPMPSEKYNRQKHFGTWIEEVQDEDCYNIRNEVLIRDSNRPVRFAASNPCRVESGQWFDVYSGETLNSAEDIQIDHVVALKNAYDSGAYSWNWKLRCLYANFMGHDVHLLAVSGRENQQKSDKSPEHWMPTDQRYACQHLQNWLAIKFVWNLNLSQTEATAIAGLVKKYRCHPRMFQPAKSEMAEIRAIASSQLNLCQ